MKAAVFEQFQQPIEVRAVDDPVPRADSAVISVKACGICRSDWHGWMGHDSDVRLPHVPGHELAGEVVAIGSHVRRWKIGQRVTVPFCCGCGTCYQCETGNQQICDSYTQPGFTQWGAFAEYVEIRFADVNLVQMPDSIDFITAASLGCRFSTAFRAVVHHGQVRGGDWVAVYGCGGVGLSAIMIADAVGANVIAVDIQAERLLSAQRCGAQIVLNAREQDAVSCIRDLTSGGVDVSLDALGSHETCRNSVLSLRKRGRHIQVGLMLGRDADPPVPMGQVIANELQLLGSHGMQAFDYPRMLRMISNGKLNPQIMVSNLISLDEAALLLPQLNDFPGTGVTVLTF